MHPSTSYPAAKHPKRSKAPKTQQICYYKHATETGELVFVV